MLVMNSQPHISYTTMSDQILLFVHIYVGDRKLEMTILIVPCTRFTALKVFHSGINASLSSSTDVSIDPT